MLYAKGLVLLGRVLYLTMTFIRDSLVGLRGEKLEPAVNGLRGHYRMKGASRQNWI